MTEQDDLIAWLRAAGDDFGPERLREVYRSGGGPNIFDEAREKLRSGALIIERLQQERDEARGAHAEQRAVVGKVAHERNAAWDDLSALRQRAAEALGPLLREAEGMLDSDLAATSSMTIAWTFEDEEATFTPAELRAAIAFHNELTSNSPSGIPAIPPSGDAGGVSVSASPAPNSSANGG